MNIDRTMNTELSQLRDLADAQQKMIATLLEEKEALLKAINSLMEQPTMSPLSMSPEQRKTLWAAHALARAAIARAEGRAS